MRFVGVEETFHLSINVGGDVLKEGMFYPVLGSVPGEGRVLDAALVKMFVKLKKDTEADSRKGGMCGLWDDVVARAVAPAGEAAGDEPFLDGEVRKLDHAGTVNFGDRDQAGTCTENGFLGILRAPTRVDSRSGFRFEIDYDGFRKLVSTKWANGNCQTLEEAFGVFPLLIVDTQQRALVGFIQSFRQFF
jgi:YD repeat-containing protein